MNASPSHGPYTGAAALARAARQIASAAPHAAPALAPLLVLSDPQRLPDPVALARHLPAGCAIIYRHFGAQNAARIARQAATVCRQRGLHFLLSHDPDLALPPGAGVHFPERLHGALAGWRQAWPDAPCTAAAHSVAAGRAALAAGADAVLLSPVFASTSPSAARALGADRFARMARAIDGPVYALGGIDAKNALALRGSAAGLAVVSAIRGE